MQVYLQNLAFCLLLFVIENCYIVSTALENKYERKYYENELLLLFNYRCGIFWLALRFSSIFNIKDPELSLAMAGCQNLGFTIKITSRDIFSTPH